MSQDSCNRCRKKAEEIKAKGEQIWHPQEGAYLDSKQMSIEAISKLLHEYEQFETLSELRSEE